MAEVVGAPSSPPATSTAAPVRRAGLALAVASVPSNLLGYAFAVVLSRALGPGDYGALSALLALGLIGSVPAISLQLRGRPRGGKRPSDRGSRLGPHVAVLGGGAASLWRAAPVATAFLDLVSRPPRVVIGGGAAAR